MEPPGNSADRAPFSNRAHDSGHTGCRNSKQALPRETSQKSAKSVWQFYRLISTQWPTRPAGLVSPPARKDGDVLRLSPADILGGPAPVFLANTTLESYIQGNVPSASSSCMDCHANATTASGPKQQVQFSDFTYILPASAAPTDFDKITRYERGVTWGTPDR